MASTNLSKMTALVTGPSGFVGQHLCAAMLDQEYKVKAAVRAPCQLHKNAELVIVGAINGDTDWSDALRGVDVIVHLAGRAHVMKEQFPDPASAYFEVNLHGTTNLAKQAAVAGVKRFVYVSTIKVNGEQTLQGHSFNELDIPQPQDAYAISKWQAEQALQLISQEAGMEIVVVRPPLVYGPEVKANFRKLLTLISRGIPLPLASIENSRSLIYVGNLVDALIACATHPAAAGQTYLVSDGEDVSTPQLVRAVAHALHRPGRIFPMPVALMRGVAKLFGKSAAVDRLTQSLVIDSSKIRKELGWQLPYTLAQGLQATAEWYLQLIRSQKA